MAYNIFPILITHLISLKMDCTRFVSPPVEKKLHERMDFMCLMYLWVTISSRIMLATCNFEDYTQFKDWTWIFQMHNIYLPYFSSLSQLDFWMQQDVKHLKLSIKAGVFSWLWESSYRLKTKGFSSFALVCNEMYLFLNKWCK